jgi:hypothetical protein
MKIEIKKENENCITVTIVLLEIYAEFETFDDATQFIQSVLYNINTY